MTGRGRPTWPPPQHCWDRKLTPALSAADRKMELIKEWVRYLQSPALSPADQ